VHELLLTTLFLALDRLPSNQQNPIARQARSLLAVTEAAQTAVADTVRERLDEFFHRRLLRVLQLEKVFNL